MTRTHAVVRAPRGPELTCRGWGQEAALRMLMNNLDPEVAEDPDHLVVYGGTGRAARSWEAYEAIVRELRRLADDETLLVQSGKPVGVFRTHPWAPRVLIANSNLVGRWATWEHFRELERRRPDDVRPDDRRVVDLHRDPGHPAGHLRDVRRAGSPALRRNAPGPGRAHRRARRDGRRTTAGGHDERGRVPRDRGRPRSRPQAARDRLRRPPDERSRRGAGVGPGRRGGGRCHLDRAGRQCRRDRACVGGRRRAIRRRHRPDLRSRRAGRLRARRDLAGRRRRASCRRSPTSTSGARCARWPTTSGRCSPSRAAGSIAFDYGNNLRAQALEAGVADAFDYPGFVPAFIRPQFCEGRGPFRWAALSGDPADILRTDRAILELFPDDAGLRRWIEMAQARVPFQGLPARICWLGYGERAQSRGRLQRARRVGRGLGADRDRARPPRLGLGGVTEPRDGGHARRHRRGRRLAAPQRPREHGGWRHLGVDPSRRRGRDRLQPARRHGRRGRRHASWRRRSSSGCSRRIRGWASSATPTRATSARSRLPGSAVSGCRCSITNGDRTPRSGVSLHRHPMAHQLCRPGQSVDLGSRASNRVLPEVISMVRRHRHAVPALIAAFLLGLVTIVPAAANNRPSRCRSPRTGRTPVRSTRRHLVHRRACSQHPA